MNSYQKKCKIDCWVHKFVFYQVDKEFENIQKLVLNNFNFHIEIKHIRKSQTVDWHN